MNKFDSPLLQRTSVEFAAGPPKVIKANDFDPRRSFPAEHSRGCCQRSRRLP
ncbi:MAG UNVERIFIED_CONTAM: hypothetical protein LVR18_26175 [Planctomycetaceae bacterium]